MFIFIFKKKIDFPICPKFGFPKETFSDNAGNELLSFIFTKPLLFRSRAPT